MAMIILLLNNQTASILLQLLNSTIQYALIAALLYEINGKKINWVRIIPYSVIMLFTINIPRLIYYYYGRQSAWEMKWDEWLSGMIYGLLDYRNPVWLILCCFAIVVILKLPWQGIKKQLVVVFCGYQMLVCLDSLINMTLWLGVVDGILDMRYDPYCFLGIYMYLFAEFTNTLPTVILIAVWHLLRRYIKANQHKIKVFAEKEDGRLASTWWIYTQILTIWLIVTGLGLVDETSGDATQVVVRFCYTFALMFINVLVIYLDFTLKIKDTEAKNHLESIKAMSDTINNFRGIKHDFNNIIQTYDGYFELEDYEGLKKYHAVLRNKTVAAGQRLDLQTTFAEKPAILGLINAVSNYAEELGVNLTLTHENILNEIAIPDFDLCRVLSILLNNAIEHAARTNAKTVSLSVQYQSNSQAIVIVANSTDSKINTAEIFKEGFSTKQGHMGHGLAEVNKILADYFGSTIMPNSLGDTFVMCLSVPLSGVDRSL